MTTRDTSPALEPIPVLGQARFGPGRSIVGQAREHKILMDMRKARGGDDSAPTPPEFLALSLAGCVLNMSRLIAEQRGLSLERLEAAVTGSIDPSKAFGLESQNRAGFLDLVVRIDGTEDWPLSERVYLLQALKERCVVCDNLSNPTALSYRLGEDRDPANG